MIIVFCFISLFLLCHSAAADTNLSMPISCPERFECPGFVPFGYPFYDVTDTRCGLIKVNCTSKEIQFGGRSYEFIGKFDLSPNSDSIVIYNRTFEQLVRNKSSACDALMYNFTSPSPSPLLYSVSIFPTITLFKCPKNLTYFEKHKYNSYNSCKDHTFYYNYFNGTIPTYLPITCQVVQLPQKISTMPGIDETNIFSLISPVAGIVFKLSDSCKECRKKGVQTGGEQTPITNRGHRKTRHRLDIMLVIAGAFTALILSFVIFIIWRQ
ncbi:hypothetical protein M8C21_031432, partial [Ambrosia artemisiifolia]